MRQLTTQMRRCYNQNTPSQPTVYPPTYNNQGTNIDFGAPLVYANKETKAGVSKIYLGPVLEIAKWAGAEAKVIGDIIKVTRGKYVLSLKVNSTTVDLTGRRTSLSVATQRYNGTLYAPLGTILEGIGGTATYDQNTNRINIALGNKRGYIQLQ